MSWDLPGPPGYSTHPRSCKEGKDARQSLNCLFANSLADLLSHYLAHSSGVKDVSTLSDESRALALPRIHRLVQQLEGKRALRSVAEEAELSSRAAQWSWRGLRPLGAPLGQDHLDDYLHGFILSSTRRKSASRHKLYCRLLQVYAYEQACSDGIAWIFVLGVSSKIPATVNQMAALMRSDTSNGNIAGCCCQKRWDA